MNSYLIPKINPQSFITFIYPTIFLIFYPNPVHPCLSIFI